MTSNSLGYDAGVIIPNFSNGYNGVAPDMGAHEHGTDPIIYGVNASQPQDVLAVEDEHIEQLIVYPIPTNGKLHIDNLYGEQVNVKLYDSNGRLLLKKKLVKENNNIDVSTFTKGVYFLKIYDISNNIFKNVTLILN